MKSMNFDELMDYDLGQIDLFHDLEGKKEVIPPRGSEELFIRMKIEAWKERVKDKKTPHKTQYMEEDDEDGEEETTDLSDLTPEDVIFKWRQHLYNIELTRKIKKDAKELASEEPRLVYCCFDLQQVLDYPFTIIGDVFYKRCLSNYNFVVNDTKNAFCYFWEEVDGNRGVNEIASNLISFAQSKAEKGSTNIMALCDGCGGQNQNRPIAAALSYIVKTTAIQSFYICYLQKGHTENCADDIHD